MEAMFAVFALIFGLAALGVVFSLKAQQARNAAALETHKHELTMNNAGYRQVPVLMKGFDLDKGKEYTYTELVWRARTELEEHKPLAGGSNV